MSPSGGQRPSGNRWKWIARRLSLMSPPEVLYRIGVEGRKRLQAVAAGMSGAPPPVELSTGDEIAPIRWFIDLSRREEHVARLFGEYGWNAEGADRLMAHRHTLFALQDVSLGASIDWNTDYRSGTRAPLRFGPTMDYRDERLCGDIKYVWELSRHHHLVELAKAAYLTGSKAYGDEVKAQILSWIASCPYPKGVHWSSSLESALRIINWTYTMRLLAASGHPFVAERNDDIRTWLGSVRQHLRFIRANLSGYSSANNHLIGEACGLFVGALSYTFPESSRWLTDSREILEREIRRQTWNDGVNKEQAVHYQVFVFDLFLVAGLLARTNGMDFSPRFWEVLEAMAEFVYALVGDDGQVPAIGDDDDAHVLILSSATTATPYQALLTSAAAVFGRGDFRARAAGFGEEHYWLLGQEGRRSFDAALRKPGARTAFPDGGYYLLVEEDSWLLFDCGPLGYLSLAAHGHADALSFCLRYKGKDLLIDPGTYVYHTQRDWRDYFRGTAAHNTLRLDGLDQSVGGGTFFWLTKGHADLLDHSVHHVRGRHAGYQRLPHPATHVREITYEPEKKQYTVTDVVGSTGCHRAELFFHFPPEASVDLRAGGALVRREGVQISITPDGNASEVRLVRGSVDPILGWTSRGFDRKVPSCTLVCRFPEVVSATMTTVIRLL